MKPIRENQAIDAEENPDYYDCESCRESQISRRLGPIS